MITLGQIAATAAEYQNQYQTGELSGSEFKELMESLNAYQHIQSTAGDLEQDMLYRQIIMGALQIASAVG